VETVFRLICHHSQIASRRQVESGAMRITVDHGDNRLRHRPHARDNRARSTVTSIFNNDWDVTSSLRFE
jgi:hypothetical protein